MRIKVEDLVNSGFKLIAGDNGISKEIEGVYICDLLSWVMAHAKAKSAWITIQTHINIVAVALLAEISCIIIPENAKLDEEAKRKADEEGIPILSFSGTSYEAAITLYEMMK
ncbi:DRTGG domain protein [Thermoanaerobacter mathranii subsp. mathranii str. A3]|jgi:predicted transcriptional regulator|uniref:DRTGG domain protein n=3 Tax=Thermoanaerobacter TaxID=1754 RepID=D3T820_THEIA|nr:MULTISPECIES: DRTGG domain-containing protein [Thermoanaerobacter]ADD02102.1 DRTGG domain protein [Thermoanaerobacter italicus Ab9]ADH60599.1 DRTGG domain protein [Thermoanaerobacter mathranii subsp. mathranii str. A3]MBT1279593.1 AraC family transcriptional regulator [Thermoanaerobacter sp. CM-CNRG TB177]MDP9751358.1 putative transcriptional regulator [Thermoanaerobacter pentosaceus]